MSVTEIEKEIADRWKRAFNGISSSNKNNLAMTVDNASKSSKSKFGKKLNGRCRKYGNKITEQAITEATRKVSTFTPGRMVILQRTALRKVATKKC